MLHYAIYRATCLAILLRHKLHEKLHGVTYHAIIKSRNILVAAIVARSRIKFYFSQRLRQQIFEALHSNTLIQLVSQCFVRSANKQPITPLLMQLQQSRFTCCDKLHEKLHSVTPPLEAVRTLLKSSH